MVSSPFPQHVKEFTYLNNEDHMLLSTPSIVTIFHSPSFLPSCSNILTAFLLLLAGIIVSSAIFALEILYTSQRPPNPAPPQITYDKIEFFSSHQPFKQDNGLLFMKTGGKRSEPLRWSSMEPLKIRASNRKRL